MKTRPSLHAPHALVAGLFLGALPSQSSAQQPQRSAQAPSLAIVEILGLYRDDGTYQRGYKSLDHRGRIYANMPYTPGDPGRPGWRANFQYIDVTVEFQPASLGVFDGATILWTFHDPDDPSNDDTTMDAASRRILDQNDYNGRDDDRDGIVDGSEGGDNTGSRDRQPVWGQLDPRYTLDPANRTRTDNGRSRVRFSVTDHGGDNFVLYAYLRLADGTIVAGDSTGVMTVWKRVSVETVRMGGNPRADEIPPSSTLDAFSKAFVEFHLADARGVPPRYIEYKSDARRDYWAMGRQDEDAGAADYAMANLDQYVSRANGQFSREGAGWFFLASAHDWIPLSGWKSLILYPRVKETGDDRGQFAEWIFGGMKKGENTDGAYRVYASLDQAAGEPRVRVFKDAMRNALVAEGFGRSSVVLEERNGSGLYGLVTLGFLGPDPDITLEFADFGPADVIDGNHLTLADPLPQPKDVGNVYRLEGEWLEIAAPAPGEPLGFDLWASGLSRDRATVSILKKWYSVVDNPNDSEEKDLADLGWTRWDRVQVRVSSVGASGTSGIAASFKGPQDVTWFNGRVMLFSDIGDRGTMIHELGHALGMAHRGGNLDYTGGNACVMAYDNDPVLDQPRLRDLSRRKPIPWTHGNTGERFCARHLLAIRQARLEEPSNGRQLGW